MLFIILSKWRHGISGTAGVVFFFDLKSVNVVVTKSPAWSPLPMYNWLFAWICTIYSGNSKRAPNKCKLKECARFHFYIMNFKLFHNVECTCSTRARMYLNSILFSLALTYSSLFFCSLSRLKYTLIWFLFLLSHVRRSNTLGNLIKRPKGREIFMVLYG